MVNAIIDRLGEYSQKNLPLMVFDSEYYLSGLIWDIADRMRRVEIEAQPENLNKILSRLMLRQNDAVLIRLVENLSVKNQKLLAERFIKLNPKDRGKYIFTTNDFLRVDEKLLSQICSIRFRFDFVDNQIHTNNKTDVDAVSNILVGGSSQNGYTG